MSEDGLRPRIEFAPMERRHVAAVTAVEAACFASHWPESAFLNELANRCSRYFVALVDGEVTGFSGMWVIMDEAHITTVAVLPAYRRRHIGERLLLTLIDCARSLGARRATLEVRTGNTGAIRLYERFAFRSVAIRRHYYADNGEDALLMWVNDLRAPDFEETLHMRRLGIAAT